MSYPVSDEFYFKHIDKKLETYSWREYAEIRVFFFQTSKY
jgi:hypothetical protein